MLLLPLLIVHPIIGGRVRGKAATDPLTRWIELALLRGSTIEVDYGRQPHHSIPLSR